MKILQYVGLMMIVSFTLGGTSGCTSAASPPNGIEIRIANRSGVDFERVDVTFPSGKVEYGPVAKGATSGYRRVDKAYRYAKVETVANGGTLTLQPQDFMGETPLEPGRYTYALQVDDTGRALTLELVEDQG